MGPGEVAGEGDALVLEQLLELLLGHLAGGHLALEPVVLLPQAVVLGLEVTLVEGAAPGLADRPEHRGAASPTGENTDRMPLRAESMGPKPRQSRVSSVIDVRTSNRIVKRVRPLRRVLRATAAGARN